MLVPIRVSTSLSVVGGNFGSTWASDLPTHLYSIAKYHQQQIWDNGRKAYL